MLSDADAIDDSRGRCCNPLGAKAHARFDKFYVRSRQPHRSVIVGIEEAAIASISGPSTHNNVAKAQAVFESPYVTNSLHIASAEAERASNRGVCHNTKLEKAQAIFARSCYVQLMICTAAEEARAAITGPSS